MADSQNETTVAETTIRAGMSNEEIEEILTARNAHRAAKLEEEKILTAAAREKFKPRDSDYWRAKRKRLGFTERK